MRHNPRVSETGRVIACPSCATGYFLPADLIGSGGARVRCPQCGRTFVVEAGEAGAPGDPPPSRTVSPAAPSGMPEAAASQPPAVARDSARSVDFDPSAGAATPSPAPDQIARAVLDALADRIGASMAHAASEGRLFAAHGREIMESFDAWRRQAGRDADPAVFRAALKARWGVDLE
jgi:predicted Zn finger-like uncharacterized protein